MTVEHGEHAQFSVRAPNGAFVRRRSAPGLVTGMDWEKLLTAEVSTAAVWLREEAEGVARRYSAIANSIGAVEAAYTVVPAYGREASGGTICTTAVKACALCRSHADLEHHSTYLGQAIIRGTSWITKTRHYHAGEREADTLHRIREIIRQMEGE